MSSASGRRVRQPEQRARRMLELLQEYPPLARLWLENAFHTDAGRLLPNPDIRIQVTDVETLLMRPSYRGTHSDVIPGDGRIGERFEELVACSNIRDEILGRLNWYGLEGRRFARQLTGDIMRMVNPDHIDFLVWVECTNWFGPPVGEGKYGPFLGRDLVFYVYLPPKGGETFRQIGQRAVRERRARDNAHRFPPAYTPPLAELHSALQRGAILTATRALRGLAQVHVDFQQGTAFGEHRHVEQALVRADVDALDPGRSYHDVYGSIYAHEVHGSDVPTSNIDAIIAGEGAFIVVWDGSDYRATVYARRRQEVPAWARRRVQRHGGIVFFERRGYRYAVKQRVFPDGYVGCSMAVEDRPRRPDESDAEYWQWMNCGFTWQERLTGTGPDIWASIQNALAAEPEEIAAGEMPDHE